MDYYKNGGGKSLKLIPLVFERLHEELIKTFSEEYSLDARFLLDYQLYGFDLYDDLKPNLKKFILSKTSIHVNGKYLYNKMRDWNNGKKEVKLTREYIYVYFNALGYKDIFEFISITEFDSVDRQTQLRLAGVYENGDTNDEYYVGYYYGEDHEIIKTTLIIYNHYKNVDWTLFYWENDLEPSLYTFKGVITEVQETITLYFPKDNATTERAVLISIFVGNKNIVNRPFLTGTYSGFDRNNSPVAGKIIFERFPSAEAQKKAVLARDIDIIIRNEIVGERTTVNSILPQNKFELSKESIDASRLSNYCGHYTGFLMNSEDETIEKIHLSIEQNNNKATISFSGNRIDNGYFKLVSRGEVFYGLFDMLETYNRLVIILNSNFYKENYLLGTYSGIDEHNRPIGGRICFMKSKYQDGKNLPELIFSNTKENEVQKSNTQSNFIYNFFLGNEDKFAPSLYTLKKIEAKFKSNGLQLIDDHIHNVLGVYLVYYLDEDKQSVNKDVLEIKQNQDVVYKSCSNSCAGVSDFFGDGLLSINITKSDNHLYYSQFLIFVGRYQSDEIAQLTGTFNTLGKDYAPTAYKVILSKIYENYHDTVPERLKLDDKKFISLSKHLHFKKIIENTNGFIKCDRSVNECDLK